MGKTTNDDRTMRYTRRTSGEEPETGDTPILLKLGANIRKLRELHGWTQTELAEKCSHTQVWVSHVERGVRDPKVCALPTLAKALRVSVGALLG